MQKTVALLISIATFAPSAISAPAPATGLIPGSLMPIQAVIGNYFSNSPCSIDVGGQPLSYCYANLAVTSKSPSAITVTVTLQVYGISLGQAQTDPAAAAEVKSFSCVPGTVTQLPISTARNAGLASWTCSTTTAQVKRSIDLYFFSGSGFMQAIMPSGLNPAIFTSLSAVPIAQPNLDYSFVKY